MLAISDLSEPSSLLQHEAVKQPVPSAFLRHGGLIEDGHLRPQSCLHEHPTSTVPLSGLANAPPPTIDLSSHCHPLLCSRTSPSPSTSSIRMVQPTPPRASHEHHASPRPLTHHRQPMVQASPTGSPLPLLPFPHRPHRRQVRIGRALLPSAISQGSPIFRCWA
jgi:hypothetical protein